VDERIKRALKTARRVQSGMVWVNGVGNHFKGTLRRLQESASARKAA